jgi:hypothetical protein
VIGAGGYQVSLYSRPTVLEQVASDAPWDLERLAESVEGTFQPLVDQKAPV